MSNEINNRMNSETSDGMSNEESNDTNVPSHFRVEVSGWGSDDSFFVEKTDLTWSGSGDKKLLLHHALAEGALIFVRLQASRFASSPIPIPYEVSGVEPMNRNGQCELRLTQFHPRSKESNPGEVASYLQEDSKTRESNEVSTQLEEEEILQ
jgi:hypothetical protein